MMISAKSSTTTSIDVTKREEVEEGMGSENVNVNTNMKMMKYCVDCKTTKTPLWRGGPSGPKSLCNACGIRYRKKRISTMPMKLHRKRDKTTAAAAAAAATTTTTTGYDRVISAYGNKELGELMVVLGKDLLLQNSIVKKQRCQRRRKMGEEELAAVSLMALSSGVVFA